jgi:hypothetical protein
MRTLKEGVAEKRRERRGGRFEWAISGAIAHVQGGDARYAAEGDKYKYLLQIFISCVT